MSSLVASKTTSGNSKYCIPAPIENPKFSFIFCCQPSMNEGINLRLLLLVLTTTSLHVLQVNVIEPKSYIWLLKSMIDDASKEESSNPSFVKKPDSLVPFMYLLYENFRMIFNED